MIKETELYPMVNNYLTEKGYTVKAEVDHCDVVAVRADEPPLIVELKIRLNLELVLQAADRLKISDIVYIAFPVSAPIWKRHWRRVRNLARRMEIGILTLNLKTQQVIARLDPAPFQPSANRRRQARLLTEFEHRVGNHNVGGSSRKEIMTAYRQDVLLCASVLADGVLPLAEIRVKTELKYAHRLLQKNHYGWFDRVTRGHYQLSPKGQKALVEYVDIIAQITQKNHT